MALKKAEAKYITGVMKLERVKYEKGWIMQCYNMFEYITDIVNYSENELKYIFANYIFKNISIDYFYRNQEYNISRIYANINKYGDEDIYTYGSFVMRNCVFYKHIIITCYDRRKCPIVAIALCL